jgi:hypothetical protein
MTSTLPKGTLGSVASLLAATLYQGNPDRNHKLWNIVEFSETDIFNMLEFLIDNLFAMFGGRVFQQTVGIPMGTDCIPLLVDLFLYSYETDFIHGLLKITEKKLDRSFIFTFRYIDESTYCTHMYSDCLEHFHDISFKELVGRIRVVLSFCFLTK